MKKSEILKHYKLVKVDDLTVFIDNEHFMFCYNSTKVLKEDVRENYRYFGGLQCNFHEDTQEYKNLQNWLCEIAEQILNIKNK